MKITWTTPAGEYPRLYGDILGQPHVLIAGATGSGKSVLLHGLIYTALFQSPATVNFVLIDPKRVELAGYKQLPHTLKYASEPDDIRAAVRHSVDLMERRYKTMQKNGQRIYYGADIYIIIDEFADLITTQKKDVLPSLCRIAQLGRAAKVHLIIATQRPTRDIINGQIKVNIDARIALRCPTAQDSRNIITVSGAENLPRYGQGYYLTPETMRPVLVNIPYTDPAALSARVDWWTRQNRFRRRWIMTE